MGGSGRVRAASGVIALVLIGSSCTGGHQAASPRPTQPTITSTTVRRDTTTTRQTIHASTTTPASSGSAHVDLQLLRTNARGVPHLDLRVTVKGMVPQLYSDADGSPVAGTQQDLNTRIDYGDGSLMEGTDGGGVSCKPGARLVPIDMTFNWSHDYTTSGQHTVTFKVALCQLGVVSRATTVTS